MERDAGTGVWERVGNGFTDGWLGLITGSSRFL